MRSCKLSVSQPSVRVQRSHAVSHLTCLWLYCPFIVRKDMLKFNSSTVYPRANDISLSLVSSPSPSSVTFCPPSHFPHHRSTNASTCGRTRLILLSDSHLDLLPHILLHLQMPSRCRNALNIVVTTLFAAVVLFTILLAYVTG